MKIIIILPFTLVACTTVDVRVANMSTESGSVRVCVDDVPIGETVAYGAMTRYLELPVGRVGVCGGPGAVVEDTSTIVVFGNLEVAALVDEDAPPAAGRAKARAFHTDSEAPTIDVGFPRMDGQRVLIFGELA